MTEEPIRGWRCVSDAQLRTRFGARRLALGKAIAAAGRVHRLVRTHAGEVFGSVEDVVERTTRFAGVTLVDPTADNDIGSICSCERSACEHAAAVAVALRAAMQARKPPPAATWPDARFHELR